MDTAKVASRSNSDLCAIELILNNRSMSAQARMEAICRRSQKWHRATEGSSGRGLAVRECDSRQESGVIYGG